MTRVIIKLDDSSNAKAFGEKFLIHQREFDTVRKWIDGSVLKIGRNEKAGHEAIALLGTRGSGKTSFLMSLLEYYKEHKDLCCIQLVDPTLIEEKGHIFLDILSRISEVVDDALESNRFSIDEAYEKRREWQQLLRKLSNGLPLVDGVGGTMTEPHWQDPEFIMTNGMAAVRGARELEKNFHRLLVKGLEILGKKAFIIVFDDIDIDFRKGWAVLETIRKYFASPHLITILSGDMKLYSKAVRKQQWKNFGKALLVNESEMQNKGAYFNELVTTMEAQYLQKVMKPERRIHIQTLNEKLRNDPDFSIAVNSSPSRKSYDLKEVYIKIFKRFGIRNGYQAEPYISFMMGMPLRTQIQFLSSAESSLEMDKDKHFVDPFLSDLYEHEVGVELLLSNPKLLTVGILRLLLDHGMLNDAYQLQPSTANSGLNSCFTAFSLVFNQMSRTAPFLIFDYLIKIGYTRNLISALNYMEEGSLDTPSIRGLSRHSGMLQDGVLRDMVGNMTAYMRSSLDIEKLNRNPWGGTIPLPAFARTSKQGRESMSGRIDTVFNKESLIGQTLAYIPLSISKYPNKNETLITCSVYNILAAIGELLKQEDSSAMSLLELSQIRTYAMPEFFKGNSPSSEIYFGMEIADREQEGDFFEIQEFADMMRAWKADYKGTGPSVSPYLLGKIGTRFFYASDTIDNVGDKQDLGHMLSERIVALLNAVLIEDIKESGIIAPGLNINNTNSRSTIFVNNLRVAGQHQHDKTFAFSRWILSCPLLLVYINPSLLVEIGKFVERSSLTWIQSYSVFHMMCQVEINTRRIHSSRIAEYKAIIDFAMKHELDYRLFISEATEPTNTKNTELRSALAHLIPVDRMTSSYLRNLRDYVQDEKIQW